MNKKTITIISILSLVVAVLVHSLNEQSNNAYNMCINNGQSHNVCVELYN